MYEFEYLVSISGPPHVLLRWDRHAGKLQIFRDEHWEDREERDFAEDLFQYAEDCPLFSGSNMRFVPSPETPAQVRELVDLGGGASWLKTRRNLEP